MKHELEQMRIWARNRIESGAVPDWSWQQHVKLIEALDAILHDLDVLAGPAETRQLDIRRAESNRLRLVSGGDTAQLSARFLRKRARSLH